MSIHHNQGEVSQLQIQRPKVEFAQKKEFLTEEEKRNKELSLLNQKMIEESYAYTDGQKHSHRNRLQLSLENTFKTSNAVMVQMPTITDLKSTYATSYTEKVSHKDRQKKIKNKKSRLYAKDNRAKEFEKLAKKEWDERDVAARLRMSITDEERRSMSPQQLKDIAELSRLLSADKVEQVDKFSDIIKKTVPVFGDGAPSLTPKEAAAGRAELLKEMTKKIMNINLSNIQLTNDDEIVANAQKFEDSSKLVEIYERMLKQSPGFLDSFDDKESIRGEMQSMKEKVLARIDRIKAVTSYYEVRKLVITNPYYRTHYNEELSMDAELTDLPEKRYLSKLLRASFYLGKNLQSIGIEERGLGKQGTDYFATAHLEVPKSEYMQKFENKACLLSSDEEDYTTNTEYIRAEKAVNEAQEHVLPEGRVYTDYEIREMIKKHLSNPEEEPHMPEDKIKKYYSMEEFSKEYKKLSKEEKDQFKLIKNMILNYRKIAQAISIPRGEKRLSDNEKQVAKDLREFRKEKNEELAQAKAELELVKRKLSYGSDEDIPEEQRLEKRKNILEQRRSEMIAELKWEAKLMPDQRYEHVDPIKVSKKKLTVDNVICGMLGSQGIQRDYAVEKFDLYRTNIKETIIKKAHDIGWKGSIGIKSKRLVSMSYGNKDKDALDFGDSINRVAEPFAGDLFSDMTENEVLELFDNLTHTLDKNYSEDEVGPAAQAAEEEHFLAAAVQYVEHGYARMRSLMNTVGDFSSYVHPVDLVKMMDPKMAELASSGFGLLSNTEQIRPIELFKQIPGLNVEHIKDFREVYNFCGGTWSFVAMELNYNFRCTDEENEKDEDCESQEEKVQENLEKAQSAYDAAKQKEEEWLNHTLKEKFGEDIENANAIEVERLRMESAERLKPYEKELKLAKILTGSAKANAEKRLLLSKKLLPGVEKRNILGGNYCASMRDEARNCIDLIRYSVLGISSDTPKEERQRILKEFEALPKEEKKKIEKQMDEKLKEYIPQSSEETKREYLNTVKSRGLGACIQDKKGNPIDPWIV